jgi:DNA-binding transcriptional LysR family regulator
MDVFQNVHAFVRTVRFGSFSAAARELSVSTSVVTKRVGQLEHQLKAKLFHRSTRRLLLTDVGARMLPRCLRLLAEFEDLVGTANVPEGLSGHLRIRAPTTPGALLFGQVFIDFMAQHPGVTLEIIHADRLLNPMQERCDLALGTRSSSYPGVTDVPLAPYPSLICASAGYLATIEVPAHPRDLVGLDCLASGLFGATWRFEDGTGEFAVDVRPRLFANDGLVLLAATRLGLGLALMPVFLAMGDIQAGTLVPVLKDFRPVTLLLKALVPSHRLTDPLVQRLLAFCRLRFAEPAFWDLSDALPYLQARPNHAAAV